MRSKIVLLSSVVLALSACTKSASVSGGSAAVTAKNLRTNLSPVNDMIGNYRVVRDDIAISGADGGPLLSAESGEASKFLKTSPLVDRRTVYKGTFPGAGTLVPTVDTAKDSLLVGLPLGDLGDERVIGGSITAVSAHDNPNLGMLKLSDFPMMHGRLMLAGLDGKSPQVTLVGCVSECTETSPRVPLIAFPIVSVDSKTGMLMLDLSALGRDLDLMGMEDPTGEGTGLVSVSSVATKFDFSPQTIVFDIDTSMKAVDPENQPLPDTTITVRWYIKSSSAFDSSFQSRSPTEGVGFFKTQLAADERIMRWSLAQYGEAGIKYYIKNVPAEWQPAFASSFDEWNETFQKQFDQKIFDYEFIPEGDPRNDLLVPGDIRYNIVEWDMTNVAPYGGLGPSMGNQYTGEIINANVLIQGPKIMSLYKDWYKVSDQVKELKAQGKMADAETLIRNFSRSSDVSMQSSSAKTIGHFTMNKMKNFVIHASRPELADPYAQRNDFDELPPNVDFKTYMNGYFHDMLTHELGHNLGLRHNFRGNMGATDSGLAHSTSRSVMEYLGRRYRYLDGVGEYDVMALKYGYGNLDPDHLDWFCTDENKWDPKRPNTSPECSSDDATSDPYNFFEWRLTRVIDDLTARGNSYAPVWKIADLQNELGVAEKGLLSYAIANNDVAGSLTNFFGKKDRPADQKGMASYVIARVKQQLCDPNLDLVIAGKYDQASQDLTTKQLQSLRENIIQLFSDAGQDLGIDINCKATSTVVTQAVSI